MGDSRAASLKGGLGMGAEYVASKYMQCSQEYAVPEPRHRILPAWSCNAANIEDRQLLGTGMRSIFGDLPFIAGSPPSGRSCIPDGSWSLRRNRNHGYVGSSGMYLTLYTIDIDRLKSQESGQGGGN